MWYPPHTADDVSTVYTADMKGFRAVSDSTAQKVKKKKKSLLN